jgi:hypothetical protein
MEIKPELRKIAPGIAPKAALAPVRMFFSAPLHAKTFGHRIQHAEVIWLLFPKKK